VEAEAAENGVGIVKVMGRYCGFIAMASSLASRDVNLCLIPEVHFQLTGDYGFYEAVMERIIHKRHIVIVVAEGAFEGLIKKEQEKIRQELGIFEDKRDESGNVKSIDLGEYLKQGLQKYAQEKHGLKL